VEAEDVEVPEAFLLAFLVLTGARVPVRAINAHKPKTVENR
jgi:hypothetical protein